jgi:hypothetical protein
MPKEDDQMQLTHTYGCMQLGQQMTVGTIHQQTKMTHVQCQNSVTQLVCQRFKINIILDVQLMYLERNYKITRRLRSGQIEPG